MATTPPLTLEQRRIHVAYSCTRAFLSRTQDEAKHKKIQEDWRTAVMGFGMNVLRCGLCQGIAFLIRDASEQDVATHLLSYLRKHLISCGFLPASKHRDLFEQVSELATPDYLLVTREILAVSTWLCRAVQALGSSGK